MKKLDPHYIQIMNNAKMIIIYCIHNVIKNIVDSTSFVSSK